MRIGDECFRAHPNCRGNGSWYDWGYVEYENEENEECEKVPVKLLCFLGNEMESDNPYIICHPCRFQSEREQDLSWGIFEQWEIDHHTETGRVTHSVLKSLQKTDWESPTYDLITKDTLLHHCYAVEVDSSLFDKRYLHGPVEAGYEIYTGKFQVVVAVDQYEKWPKHFLYQDISEERIAKAKLRYKNHLNCES